MKSWRTTGIDSRATGPMATGSIGTSRQPSSALAVVLDGGLEDRLLAAAARRHRCEKKHIATA